MSPSLSDVHPGISQQTASGGSFVFSGGMPPNIGPRQSIPGTLCMIGGGVPPNIALQQDMSGVSSTSAGRVFSQKHVPDTSILLSTPSKGTDVICNSV